MKNILIISFFYTLSYGNIIDCSNFLNKTVKDSKVEKIIKCKKINSMRILTFSNTQYSEIMVAYNNENNFNKNLPFSMSYSNNGKIIKEQEFDINNLNMLKSERNTDSKITYFTTAHFNYLKRKYQRVIEKKEKFNNSSLVSYESFYITGEIKSDFYASTGRTDSYYKNGNVKETSVVNDRCYKRRKILFENGDLKALYTPYCHYVKDLKIFDKKNNLKKWFGHRTNMRDYIPKKHVATFLFKEYSPENKKVTKLIEKINSTFEYTEYTNEIPTLKIYFKGGEDYVKDFLYNPSDETKLYFTNCIEGFKYEKNNKKSRLNQAQLMIKGCVY